VGERAGRRTVLPTVLAYERASSDIARRTSLLGRGSVIGDFRRVVDVVVMRGMGSEGAAAEACPVLLLDALACDGRAGVQVAVSSSLSLISRYGFWFQLARDRMPGMVGHVAPEEGCVDLATRQMRRRCGEEYSSSSRNIPSVADLEVDSSGAELRVRACAIWKHTPGRRYLAGVVSSRLRRARVSLSSPAEAAGADPRFAANSSHPVRKDAKIVIHYHTHRQ